MKKNLAAIFALLGWFAIITQFILMMQSGSIYFPEVLVRFFSYFTILTNSLVASYFTLTYFGKSQKPNPINLPGVLTAITVYISIVCLVYQIILRGEWQPQGLHRVVDELLHSVIPILVLIFWCLYEETKSIKYSQVLKWAIYPFAYLICILTLGNFSNFYPYPFIDVNTIGMAKTLMNSVVILCLFLIISTILLVIGKSIIKR